MKTIKIIDLLNKIANGEEVPKKISFAGILYETEDISKHTHKSKIGDSFFREYYLTPYFLNSEVEIIEEEKEIEKLKNTTNYYIDYKDERLNEDISHICSHLISHIDKINELIDIVNELKRDK